MKIVRITAALVMLLSLSALPASAAKAKSSAVVTPSATDKAAIQQDARRVKIIARGQTEIDRRLKTLNTLEGKVNNAAKLSDANKISLVTQLSDEVNGLNSLKTKLTSDADLASAQADAQQVITGYRVYKLIVPKVNLLKTADDQQATELKLTALATKIQTKITAIKGKDTSGVQAQLDDIKSKTAAAQTISNTIESAVVNLQPSDYNANISLLQGDRDQLKTAQTGIKASVDAAHSLITSIKSLQ